MLLLSKIFSKTTVQNSMKEIGSRTVGSKMPELNVRIKNTIFKGNLNENNSMLKTTTTTNKKTKKQKTKKNRKTT